MGFEKLIDLLVQFMEFFRFCTIVDCYQEGVALRFGKFHRELKPGFHWLIPFYVENPIIENVKPKVYQATTQSLMTADGKPVAVGLTITYEIRSIRKALLEVESVNEAIHDCCLATSAEHVTLATWDQLRAPTFCETLTAACRKLAFKYGIEITGVRIHELAPTRTYRLINGA
jgi:regulator of protease activity HflC (stomatin/prohibitin superfamily)